MSLKRIALIIHAAHRRLWCFWFWRTLSRPNLCFIVRYLVHGPTHWGWCKSSGHFKPKKKKAVVTLLKSHGSSLASSHQCSTLIIDCRSSPSFLWRLIFTPSSAKRIIVRTFFINQRSINNSSILYSHHPSFILYQLLADIWGVSYPKLCTLLTWFN